MSAIPTPPNNAGSALLRIHLLDAHAALQKASTALAEDGAHVELDQTVFDHVETICTDLSELMLLIKHSVDTQVLRHIRNVRARQGKGRA